MKIAFVCAEDEIPGICYLSAHLKKNGHEVFLVFEPKQFSRAYLRNNFLAKIFSREKENLARLKKINPDLIGFSCTTAHYQWARDFAHKVKKILPQTPIIFGGVHSTLVPELVIKEKAIDFVCQGEGEGPLLEILDAIKAGKRAGEDDFIVSNIWYKNNGRIKNNPLRPLLHDLDELPYLDKDLFKGYLPNHYREYSYYFTSRGCPYNCSYCGNEPLRKIYVGLGKYVRRMSPQRAVDELLFLKERYKTKYILFEDDVFAMDENWLTEFIPLYRKEVGLPFTCFGHVKLLTPKIIKLLKQGGCDLLWFGLQSADEKIRRDVFQRYETNEEIIRATDLCHKEKIQFMVDQILNIPHDSREAMKEALLLYNRIRPAMINCYSLLYFPKAKINEIALKAGFIKKEDISKIDEGKSIVYQTGDFSHHDDFYSRYALLLTAIPFLPKWVVAKIAGSEKLIDFFGKLPLILIPLVKILINFKIGRGFLPFAIFKMEVFFTKNFVLEKLKSQRRTDSFLS